MASEGTLKWPRMEPHHGPALPSVPGHPETSSFLVTSGPCGSKPPPDATHRTGFLSKK